MATKWRLQMRYDGPVEGMGETAVWYDLDEEFASERAAQAFARKSFREGEFRAVRLGQSFAMVTEERTALKIKETRS